MLLHRRSANQDTEPCDQNFLFNASIYNKRLTSISRFSLLIRFSYNMQQAIKALVHYLIKVVLNCFLLTN